MSSTSAHAPIRELHSFDAAADHFLRACEERFGRIVGYGEGGVSSASYVTNYVIPGREFTITDPSGESLTAWIGLNGSRIFFITRYLGKPEELREGFQFSLGGAEKVGWDFNYEPLHKSAEAETSIWGTVDAKERLTEARTIKIETSDSPTQMTDAGCFWVNDLAMMMQSLLRTSQRLGIKNGPTVPAPL